MENKLRSCQIMKREIAVGVDLPVSDLKCPMERSGQKHVMIFVRPTDTA